MAGQSQAGARVSLGGDGAEAITGLTVDQYGMLYKVAVPPATFSPTGLPSVVNMSPLPPTFNVASSLIQHPGIHYPPIHYAQLPSTSLQFIGSPYSLPYAVPPNFLPSPLLLLLPTSPPLTFHTLCHTPHSWQKEPLLPRLHPQPIRSAKPPLPAPRLGSCHITRVLSHWTSLQAGCPFIIRCPGSLLGTPCMKLPPQVPAPFLLLRRASLLWKQPLPMDRDREIGI